MAATQVTEKNFEEEVLNSTTPVLVDFWATWCGPCQMMGPVVEELSETETGVKFCKVNVDDSPDLAAKYGVMSIPNFVLFKNGNVAGQTIGAVGKDGLLSLING